MRPPTLVVSGASWTAATRSTFDVAALRRDFERLSVDDLTALASFPVEPHELIGRVVAVTHCLLLSLAPEHTSLELRAPPWPLLRLELLNNTSKIWRKLRKRAWQLETGAKSLSHVQLRFGFQELVPFVLPPEHENRRYQGTWQLERVAQVSTIAASLGAWVVFCLCCSRPSNLRHLQDQNVALPRLPNIKISSQCQVSSQMTSLESLPSQRINLRVSRRVGLKAGGCFLLYHVRIPLLSSSRPPVDTLGEWSVYCLDVNRIGRQNVYGDLNGSWWKPPREIKTSSSSMTNPVTLCHLTPLAQQSLLLQLGVHSHMFERPVQKLPHVQSPRSSPLVFTLKFNVMVVDSLSRFSLVSIGNVWITMATTVAQVRGHLSSSIASNRDNKRRSFRFMDRGSLLAVSQERHLAAVSLLPYAMIVVADNNQAKSCRVSQLWRHQSKIARALVNGLPDHLPQTELRPSIATSVTSAPQVFALYQSFPVSTSGASTSSEIVEIFTHWRAFVHFQALQDSSVLFQLPQRSKLKRRLHEELNERDESVSYGPKLQPLPRKKFNSKHEWLLPLFALVDVASSTVAVLKTPFRQDVQCALRSPCRLVLAEARNVIHVTRTNCVATERDTFGLQVTVFDMTFIRDESCPLESLLHLNGAYVWLIMPRTSRQVPVQPPEWLLALHRFVRHPQLDFQSPTCPQVNHFRVRMAWDVAERAIEAAFWSKHVDWTPSVRLTDLYSTVLRRIFNALCSSHPPAFGVDSVKFSKLLYEASVQPKLLSIGDAAFLFASNLSLGSPYELDFDGFVRAVEWLAHQFFSDSGTQNKTSPSKTTSCIQHAMSKWQRRGELNARDRLTESLRRFCYEILVHLPSLTSTWHDIMDFWRLARKHELLHEYALQYCAATRLRASWIGVTTWRRFLQRRRRIKDERLAAIKLQTLARGRRLYVEYQRVRRIVTRTQLRIHARVVLRRLRVERTAFLERMRLRLVTWMRSQLWLLREWKRSNAEKVARRDRIRDKRRRCLGVAIFPLETWRVRFALYRANSAVPTQAAVKDSIDAYELEVMDSTMSWGVVLCVSQQKVDQFVAEELERQTTQLQSGFATISLADKHAPNSVAAIMTLNKFQRGRTQATTAIVRDSVVFPVWKPNITLLALARRLFILKDMKRNPVGLRCYVDPTDTSLGKLVFKGVMRSDLAQDSHSVVQRHVVRVLEWANTLKLLVYTPATSARRRYDLDSSFVVAVLQFSRFQTMRLEDDDDVIVADRQEQSRGFHHQIHRILNGPRKLLALQCVLTYVLKYGVHAPTYSMMPLVTAARERQQEEREAKQRRAVLHREQQLIVKVQTHLRQHLARKTRLQLALASYSKPFDRESGRFVYILRYLSGERVILGEQKPFSLFDQDVALLPDEWLLVSDADHNTRFLNPHRGVYSRFNDILAATQIQRWYRGKMWHGINNWKLRDLVNALRYHKKPTSTDPGQLEHLKRYALQLHVLNHQYKAAYPIYEAALKVAPDDIQTLVCLALLLIISCRYPATQSWQRALTLLQQVRDQIDDVTSMLHEIEQNYFRWALFLQPKNPHAIANYAVYLQCVRLDIDKAELLYRRALDLDPINDLVVTNFQRLQSERAPGRHANVPLTRNR